MTGLLEMEINGHIETSKNFFNQFELEATTQDWKAYFTPALNENDKWVIYARVMSNFDAIDKSSRFGNQHARKNKIK